MTGQGRRQVHTARAATAVGDVNDSELDSFMGEMPRDAGFSESRQTFTTWIWGRGLVKAEAAV